MPIGPFGEILGATGTLDNLGEGVQNYKSKVVAPRNPKLVKGERPVFKMKPSQFLFQVSLDTEKKLANMHTMNVPTKTELLDMSELSHQKISSVNIDEPMFQPFPSEIFFQNYKPFETYEVPLILRNNDKVPRLVKVTQQDSPYFKIISPHDVGHKVGPGLPTTFRLEFTPEEDKDYLHEVTVTTERERFVVPVKCIGARAILDFPDDVMFAASPVKYNSSKTLLVRNVGRREAKFSLSTENPFKVSVENGVLPVNESMQITIDFNPQACGDHQKDLVLHYDTGEDIYISLYGAAQDANVRLDKNSIRVENTYISMANQRTVTISNRSNVIGHFRWTKFATQEEEDMQKRSFAETLKSEEATEKDRFLEECIQDPSLRDKMSILSRTFHNKTKLVQDDRMPFSDDVIRIEPCEGDIWPNSTTEVNIVFKPEASQTYSRTAFCDVTGRESRLPLRIRGDGIGPKAQFSFDDLDIGNVFVNSIHTYEVVLANKGDIDAMFNLVPTNSVFGPCFQFNPSEGIVMPDGHQAIQIQFASSVLGDFKEEFEFQIDGSPSNLKLTFSGAVIGPTFHFDVPKLKFGTISYGFVSSQTVTLHNTALVPMSFNLRVPGDGTGESICSTSEYDSTLSEAGSMMPPKEFEVTPSSGRLEPKSKMNIKIDVCSNTVKKYDLPLVVDVEGVGDEVVTLPISARCVVPQITVLSPILDYGRCFLRHPYEHHVKLQNDTELPAKYELVPQHVDEYTSILYTSPQPRLQGIIQPNSTMDVPLIITPQGLEELETTAHFVIFGSPDSPLPVHVVCIGEGPVVHIMPMSLDWGTVPVLTDIPKTVRLSNESLIPAKFTAHMVRPNSVWRVEPTTGEIPPEQSLDLTVTACLDDCVRFNDKLQINIVDGPSRLIPMTGYGKGTTIVADPPMSPVLNLGPHFSKGPCVRTFTLTNRGRRHQSLVWSTEGFPFLKKPKNPKSLAPINTKDMKVRDMPAAPNTPDPIFKLSPHRMELSPGESVNVTLEGIVDNPQVVKERMLCHAIIGKAGGKELIMKVQVNSEFISPLLEFSSESVTFRVDKHPVDELQLQTKDFELTNVSSLPLTANLALPYPFQIIEEGSCDTLSEKQLYMGIGESKTIAIQFDPAYKDDSHIRIVEEMLTVTYQEHPHVDEISLRGEVYFPNIDFEKQTVDFGCILNDTEVTRYVNITNNSPMEVKYKWSFLIDDQPVAVFHPRPAMAEIDDIGEQTPGGSIHGDPAQEGEEVEVTVEGAVSPKRTPSPSEQVTEELTDPDKAELIDDIVKDTDGEEKKDEMKPVDDEQTECPIDAPPQDTDENKCDADETPRSIPIDHDTEDGGIPVLDTDPETQITTTPKPEPPINPVLASLLRQEEERSPLGVEEIFDILPLYGTLKPGDTEQITLTFYGHADIGSQAKAICEVEGGPTYEVILKGEASLVSYKFDCLDIDYGKIMYDQVAVAEIGLINTGRVGFEFTALGMDPGMAAKPKPGVPVMIPHSGFIEPYQMQILTVKYLPGVPEKFHKSFPIQVAHFEPDTINLFGEGVFPRISLDLPREGPDYESMVKEARENLSRETKKRPMSAVSTHRDEANMLLQSDTVPTELDIQMEVERMVVHDFAHDQYRESSRPDVLEVHQTNTPKSGMGTRDSKKSKKKTVKPKARMPDYVLDFGHVVLGTVRTHIVRATNTGWFPCSFSVDHDYVYQYGFNVQFDRYRALPGAPDHETVDFVVSFDPRGANLPLGEVSTVVPLNIVGGPQVVIVLKANVTMPDMQISTDVLDFEEVRCGECKVITVQLYNHKHVRCDWNSLPSDKDKKKVDKHVPMHLRRKMRQDKSKPRTFEMMPPTGSLMPGQRQNVQIKFMPTEERFYENRIAIRLSQSSQRIMLLCRGVGQEPQIEFVRNLVEFGPILPHSAGDEQDIVIRNPSKFPVEVYNLEFDRTYLDEEKILRLMKGYDEYNTILLPPRGVSDKLPQELLDYYEEQMKKLEEQERKRREEEEAAEAARREQEEREAEAAAAAEAAGENVDGSKLDMTTSASRISDHHDKQPTPREQLPEPEKVKDTASTVGVGDLEVTPVSAAIARHLGLDLSTEGKAARNRRGIAVVVMGAPLSGKTTTAVALAKRYESALMTIDGIVLEAISNGNTAAGLKARELCAEAAHRRAEELRAMEGEEGEKKAQGGLSVEAVTAHTQGTGNVVAAQSVAHSMVSNRKTSTISDMKTKDKHHGGSTIAGKTVAAASSGEAGSQELTTVRSTISQDGSSKRDKKDKHQADKKNQEPANQQAVAPHSEKVPTSPPPLAAPIARRLSVSASVAGEEGLVSAVLPDDLLVEILADRLMLNDCHRGVVIDGLETLFSQNQKDTAGVVLRALNNRKYLYWITLKQDYQVMKEQEKKKQEEKERLAAEHEEQERQRLEEMSEDEYDALTEREKADVDRKRLEIKKERLKRENEEKMERERKEREAQEAEAKQKEEESVTMAKKKRGRGGPDPKDGKKSQAAGKMDAKSQHGQLKSQEGKKGHEEHPVEKKSSGPDRPESHATDRGESAAEDGKKKKGKDGKRPVSNEAEQKKRKGKKGEEPEDDDDQTEEVPKLTEEEIHLMQRFKTFEHTYKDIIDLVDHWERTTASIRPCTPVDGAEGQGDDAGHGHPPSGKKGKKGHDKNSKDDKKSDKNKDKEPEKPTKETKTAKPEPVVVEPVQPSGEDGEDANSDHAPLTEAEKRQKRLDDGIGVPNIIINCADRDQCILPRVFEATTLPSVEEVLDGLGMGPKGPPIPPPAAFSVVPYPVKRHAPPGADGGHYIFVATGPDDPNVIPEDKGADLEQEEEKSDSPEHGHKDDKQTPTKGRKKADQLSAVDKKEKGRKTSAKGGRPSRRSSTAAVSPPPGAQTPASETDQSLTAEGTNDGKLAKLNHWRWVIPAEGEITIKLRFTSEDLGQFDQTLNFEIVGTRRRYQLYCRGICAFPTISREPRIVFPHRKKSRKLDEIVHKKYILTSETFEFGPLLVGKSRDKYKEGRYPENMEKLTVLNTSPLDADISFCFLNDSKADTFILDPPTMFLKPGEQQELTLWAYPKTPQTFEDALVCCVKENPEPIIFKLLCHGVRPELELDTKTLHFDKVLLHRKDTKTLYLRNSTLLPVAWRLNGLENLGDDFSVSQESGVIDPKSEFTLHAYFRAMKPVNTNRKSVRLEVSDVDNIMGLVQTENIQVHAEAYDVALDMSFPKGADGGIDFDVIRVGDEQKQTCSLKNKGKYDIAYSFTFEPTPECPQEVCDMFSVIPNKGSLSSVDRPAQVQVMFKSNKEVTVKDQPILRCKVVEPSIGDDGETIASIPIKMSVKSVFSKYNIFPVNDINFGSLLVNSKKTRTLTIENKGDRFEFKYTITKMMKEQRQEERRSRQPGRVGESRRNRSRDGSSSGRSANRPRRAESIRQDVGGANQSRLSIGMFNIFPAFGYILPGGQQQIQVECNADNAGRCEEDICIDITGRDPTDNPTGIPYRLIGEACIPSINVNDVGSIFEEHRVCKNLSVWQHSHALENGGVYGEDENRFVFNNVLVGSKARARFKISNPNKVPCDVVFSVKAHQTKHSSKFPDVFEVEPARAQISAHSHTYAVVSFSPPSMQSFTAAFEAAIDGVPQNQAKGKSLSFDVAGEGNLPRISIMKPVVRNKRGQALLLFKKTLVNHSQTLPMLISNEGSLPSKVDVDMIDPDSAFSLKPTGSTQSVMMTDDSETGKKPHTACVIINVGETASFDVTYTPSAEQRSQAHIRLSVINNQYEDSVIQMVGEGYQDEVTFDNIHSILKKIDPEQEEGNDAGDDVQAAKANHIQFGDCFINESRTLTFSMTNHSENDCVRFVWPENPELKYSPQIGHLRPKCSKDFTVTFKTEAPKTMKEQEVPCKITKITFDKALSEVPDWDDRMRTVKWVDANKQEKPSSATPTEGKPSTPVPPPPQPATRTTKKKVIETEPEPAYTEVADTARSLDLLVSVQAEHTKYECKLESGPLTFKDTLMFQTRVYDFTIRNTGAVSLDYSWQVAMDNYNGGSPGPRSVTFAESERPPTAAPLVVRNPDGRPSSAQSSIITVSETPYIPFSISPEVGTVLPGKEASFTVKFSPLDINEYDGKLLCSIPNLEDGKTGPEIVMKGRSLMPYCHFELEDSDYIRSARRNPELRGPGGAPPGTTLDPTTKVIEFKNTGVGVRNICRFNIVNPTNQFYNFRWVNEDESNPKKASDFNCLVQTGAVRSGKKAECAFEFVSSTLDLVESFWRFEIPEHDISVPFLLVGATTDPVVSLDRSHLNYKSLLIGHEAVETVYMINNEDTPFHFSFIDSSLHAPGYASNLIVNPMVGNIPPNTSIPINIHFTPNSDKEVNFNVQCSIKKKTTPLSLNVKAEGYSMNCLVLCEDSAGQKVELSSKTLNQINFGEVEVNEKAVRNIYVVNSGKFNFDYSWEIRERASSKESMVSVTPEVGGVMYGERIQCQLGFCPPKQCLLRGCELLLKISNGPTYVMQVTGNGVLPGLSFNFLNYNFGPCFIHRAGMPAHATILKLTNTDKKEISVECLYAPTQHLHHDFEARVIAPGETVDMTLTFYPREQRKYHEVLQFEVNGLSKQTVTVNGLGTDMKIEVADQRHKIVKFGALRVGQTMKKVIPIVNNSPAPMTFHLGFTPSNTQLQNTGVFRYGPQGDVTLQPRGGTAKVEVVFTPKTRIPQFTEEILMECAGLSQPLFVVNGSCHGIEIALDIEAIPFGAVVQKSHSARKVVMCNKGDIGARFKWDIKKFAPDFSISPIEGYISPGMEVPFEITFHPQTVSNDIRYDSLKCMIEGSKPLKLTLTGQCIAMPSSREVVHFSNHVRQKECKNVLVANRTNMHYNLRPVIDGEYWTGPDTFTVDPQSTKPYELTYYPLIMTTEGKKHTGTLFFPLPDGTGLLYNLSGGAEPPKANSKVTRDVPCKTAYTEMLTVSNWLKKPQRFRVRTEMIRPDKLDSGTTVKGLDYIDVPGNTTRDYKLSFYAHKEGQSQLKVVFTNESTSEYQFYEVTFRAVRPGVISNIDLSTPVRQSVPHTIILKNPLTYPVTFVASCGIPEVLMPNQFTVSAQSDGEFNFEYLPLKVGETAGKLEFNCNDLGLYIYDLSLKATPAGPERALYFRCTLGTSQVQTGKFLNFAKQRTDYDCEVDSKEFHVDKKAAAAPGSSTGTEVAIDVTYEPFCIGETRSMLTVNSPLGGTYTFPLFGTCVPPKPQGPFLIKAGSTTPLSFRNVFSSTTKFSFQVDNPLFHVTKSGETIRSRKDHRIVVGFDGNDSDSKASVMGKLTVTCARSAGGATNAQWVYYLKGVTPESR